MNWKTTIVAIALALAVGPAHAVDSPQPSAPAFKRVDESGRYLDVGQFGDPAMAEALNFIRVTYGDVVDVITKGKPLVKYGKTLNADNGQKTTVMTLPGATQYNETFVETNLIDSVSSSSGSDTEEITVEGHTCASGVKTFVIQTVTLTGQTEATLSTPLCRATRAYVNDQTFGSPASDLVGTIYVYDNTGVTLGSGVPDVDANVHLMIEAGENQSEKAATSLSSVDYWIIKQVAVSLGRATGSTVNADIEIEQRCVGGVWRSLGGEFTIQTSGNGGVTFDFYPYAVIRPNCDVRLVATTTANDTAVSGYIAGTLGIIVDTE